MPVRRGPVQDLFDRHQPPGEVQPGRQEVQDHRDPQRRQRPVSPLQDPDKKFRQGQLFPFWS